MAAAGSSRFAVICALLRQEMREPHQVQEEMGIIRTFGEPVATDQVETSEAEDTRTMQLFPTPSNKSMPSVEKLGAHTLTIFYQGRVLQFENFPSDKVKELVDFAASKVSSPVRENKVHASSGMPVTTEQSTGLEQPIARKASLQRFLQKRKYRASTAESDHKGLTLQTPLEKDITGTGKEMKYDPSTTNWLTLQTP